MIAAFSFLTCFGTGATPNARTARWFGVVGLVLGGTLGGIWEVAYNWQSPFVAAVLVVAFDAALTGMLHFDGLADTADGLCAPMERERRLVVMRKPDVGAFGVVVVTLVLLLRVGALSALDPNASLLVALWVASRALAAFLMATQPYARETGLASAFEGGAELAAFAVGSILLAAALHPAAVAASITGGVAVAAFARYRVGGYTGDVLGAVIVVSETVGLLVASGMAK